MTGLYSVTLLHTNKTYILVGWNPSQANWTSSVRWHFPLQSKLLFSVQSIILRVLKTNRVLKPSF